MSIISLTSHFVQIAKQALPKSTAETAVTSHWLAVDGIQPAIPENVAPTEGIVFCYCFDVFTDVQSLISPFIIMFFEFPGLATKNLSKRKNPTEEKNLPGHRETLVQIRPSVKHVLSRQLRVSDFLSAPLN